MSQDIDEKSQSKGSANDSQLLEPPRSPLDEQQHAVAQSEKPETEPNDADDYVTGLKLAAIIICISVAAGLMVFDIMVISTAIPRITTAFNSLQDVGWYASAYQFGSAAPQPLTGKVYTYFSTKWSFLFFFAIFELGSVLCGAAVSSAMLIAGRAVAGVGAAGIINGAIMIISDCVPLEKRPGLIGLTVGIGQLGLAIGPLIGGVFTSFTTWRWCFYINVPIGAVLGLAMILLRIPEQKHKGRALSILPKIHRYLDLVGFVLFAPAVLQLLLALQYGGNQFPWKSSQVIGLFCGAAANLVVWLLWNWYKGDDALIPYSMVRIRTVWTAALFQAFFMSAVYGPVYFLPIYFQAIDNKSPVLSGVYLLPTILPELLMAGAAGMLVTKIGYVIPFAILGTILLSVSSGLFSILRPDSPTGWWVGFQILGGVGAGVGLNLAVIATQSAVSVQQLPSAMSFIVFAQSLGPAIALALCNVIFVGSLRSEISKQDPTVNAAEVISAGATGFRRILQPSALPGVLTAYANSIDRTFYFVAALAVTCGLILWGLGWQDLRAGKGNGQESNTVSNENQEP